MPNAQRKYAMKMSQANRAKSKFRAEAVKTRKVFEYIQKQMKFRMAFSNIYKNK